MSDKSGGFAVSEKHGQHLASSGVQVKEHVTEPVDHHESLAVAHLNGLTTSHPIDIPAPPIGGHPIAPPTHKIPVDPIRSPKPIKIKGGPVFDPHRPVVLPPKQHKPPKPPPVQPPIHIPVDPGPWGFPHPGPQGPPGAPGPQGPPGEGAPQNTTSPGSGILVYGGDATGQTQGQGGSSSSGGSSSLAIVAVLLVGGVGLYFYVKHGKGHEHGSASKEPAKKE